MSGKLWSDDQRWKIIAEGVVAFMAPTELWPGSMPSGAALLEPLGVRLAFYRSGQTERALLSADRPGEIDLWWELMPFQRERGIQEPRYVTRRAAPLGGAAPFFSEGDGAALLLMTATPPRPFPSPSSGR